MAETTVSLLYRRSIVLCIGLAMFLALGFGGFAVLHCYNHEFAVLLYVLIALFFVIMYGWLYFETVSAEKKNEIRKLDNHKLLNKFMIYKTAKILAGLCFILILVWNNREIKVELLSAFLTWYIVTLGFEVYTWSAMEKRIEARRQFENKSADE